MNKAIFCLALCAVLGLTGCKTAPHGYDRPERIATTHSDMPKDVVRFMERRAACDHFRNEDAYDDDRGSFLASQSALYCTGTDGELRGLRAKYAAAPEIIDALRRFEAELE